MDGLIFIYGPPGSGKSTIANLLADQLNYPAFDLDKIIESYAGMPIVKIFEKRGEAGFRAIEQICLKTILSQEKGVVALGGGSLLEPNNRQSVEAAGEVVCLQADLQIILERLSNSPEPRPLVQKDLMSLLPDLLRKREDHYHSFTNQINTSGRLPRDVEWEIQQALGQYFVRGMGRGYPVWVRDESLHSIGKILLQHDLHGPVVLVSDENVFSIYGCKVQERIQASGLTVNNVVIPVGETTKTITTVEDIWKGMVSGKLERVSTVVALGGGVVGDLAGFAASTYMRGISWVGLPTSLLAMVDSSIGGKTGADLPQGKNLIGAFHPPRLVLIDPQALSTIPENELRNGMAEVIKAGLIGDEQLYALCQIGLESISKHLSRMISKAVAVKVNIIQQDPYEGGIRAALNFGHTVGHAIEKVSGYKIKHGIAVGIGMVVETWIAEQMGIASSGLLESLKSVLSRLDIATAIPSQLNVNDLIEAMQVDKKVEGGELRFVLPQVIGKVKTGVPVEVELLYKGMCENLD